MLSLGTKFISMVLHFDILIKNAQYKGTQSLKTQHDMTICVNPHIAELVTRTYLFLNIVPVNNYR